MKKLALAIWLLSVAVPFAAAILVAACAFEATCAFLVLVWRRGELPLSGGNAAFERSFSMWRVGAFLSMRVALVLLSRSFASAAEPFAGTSTLRGTLVGFCKLAVLLPTVVLSSYAYWKQLLRAYSAEVK